MLRGIHTAAEHMQRFRPARRPTFLCPPASHPNLAAVGGAAGGSRLVLCIDRLGGLRHELAPTKVKPHLLQYVQECTSQFSGRVSHATFVRRPRARLLAFLLGCCTSSFIGLQLDGVFWAGTWVSYRTPTLVYRMIQPSVVRIEVNNCVHLKFNSAMDIYAGSGLNVEQARKCSSVLDVIRC